MFIDTHCHLNFNAFGNDFDEIIKKNIESDIWMVVVGTNLETSKKAVDLAYFYKKGVYATVGLHPIHLQKKKIKEGGVEFTTKGEVFDFLAYKNLIKNVNQKNKIEHDFCGDICSNIKLVAIGETGLDYSILPSFVEIQNQKNVFIQHIYLADETQLPIIVHARGKNKDDNNVYDDIIFLLEEARVKTKSSLQGIIHSFMGTQKQAKRFIDMGFLIGINGAIVFENNLQQTLKHIPIEKIVLETDSPYFHPSGDITKRNEPNNVKRIAEMISKIKSISIYEVSSITSKNAINIFGVLC